ncbi:DUF3934 domain-containing protein [Neobacillus sp. MM2021_6]|uniref:DUF3934 domain-containing protein n=1 Tax=Bacillaceae TaxID=186817 RepID=UPI00140C7009|nr:MULTISPECIES: DUF3934 domain-containing protein [Bacillaceae]MBO0959397.1 DUF3934 domain-containing protein [Neobacillus sp. MM2021_6]NHC20366.1 DUF3934 family protein [Bacillus sp. MM2020_4]WML38042.1 DUF3934 domain-containing protein [Neobacillus sp. OS1-2]
MSKAKAKAKSGIGRGTGKKGWNRWQAGANKAKSFKPYVSKGVKKSGDTSDTAKND